MNINEVQQEIEKKNPWYVQKQLSNLQNETQRRGIMQRWDFFREVIRKAQDENPGKMLKILDAGCGDGINLSFFSKIPNAQILGCDYNNVRVERAKKEFPDFKISYQDLTDIQMGEDSFDVILLSHVLEHIKEDELALRELRKLLAPNGLLLLGVPNEGCLLARLRNHVIEPYIAKTTDHVHFYTEKELLKKVDASGYSVVNKLYQTFFMPKQSLNNFFASKDWGFDFLEKLQRIWPSQAAGLFYALKQK